MATAKVISLGKLGLPAGSASTTEDRIIVMFLAKAGPAAVVYNATGRAIRIREMHQVPQSALPVTHTRVIGYDPV